MNDLDQLIELAGTQARGVLVELGLPQLVPSWVLINKKGQFNVVTTAWKDDEQKELARKAIRQHMRQHRTTTYSVVFEAWAAHAPSDWNPDEELQPWEHASERPDRWEVVIAIACNRKQSRIKQWKIVRDPFSGKVTDLEPDEAIEPGSWDGWLAEMLSS
jgi:hypothetical protein